MRFGSVCSGIEAASVAWSPLGWKAAWFAEIEKFPSAVLKHHYPETPNLGDMTKLEEHDVYRRTPIDLLCGGTPCQSFSVAGLRGGIKDARGNLCLTFCKIALAKRPRFVLWENVPGVLSSGGGQDFGCFLAGLSGADAPLRPPVGGWNSSGVVAGPVYGLAWRVLDAQYFGVSQRRRRVFVVGCLGDWRRAARILFEPQSLPGDSPTGGEAGQGPSAATPESPAASLLTMREGCDGGGEGTSDPERQERGSGDGKRSGTIRAVERERERVVAKSLNAKSGTRMDYETETMIVQHSQSKKRPSSKTQTPARKAKAGRKTRPSRLKPATGHKPSAVQRERERERRRSST